MQEVGSGTEATDPRRRLRIVDPATGSELGLTGNVKAAQGRCLDKRHSSKLLLILDPETGTLMFC